MSQYTIDHQPNDERADDVTARLVAFNHAHSTATPVEPHEPEPLHVFAMDGEGTLRGGLVGRTHAIPQWLEVSIIFVDEDARHAGLGSRLMSEAEAEAVHRGCRFARLATGNFQAPGFYERLGYARFGTLANCPPGETVYWYWKPLAAE